MNEFLGMPDVASAHGPALDSLNAMVHWMMFVIFIGWGLLFLYMLFRFRQKRNPKADYHGLKSKASNYAEITVAAVEAILLIGFSIPLWSDRVDDFPDEKEATVVRVVAEQFAWNIHYPGPDGIFGRTAVDLVDAETNPLGLDSEDPYAKDDITTINQLHLPVNKPAIIHLSSKDVIHSFSLNVFRTKQDAVPGINVPVWFVPTVTTAEMAKRHGDEAYQYEISCSQLCGLGHYRMRGFLTIHTQEEFDTWLADNAPVERAEGEDDFWN
jgi:cytochrome c oxidase subunit 2